MKVLAINENTWMDSSLTPRFLLFKLDKRSVRVPQHPWMHSRVKRLRRFFHTDVRRLLSFWVARSVHFEGRFWKAFLTVSPCLLTCQADPNACHYINILFEFPVPHHYALAKCSLHTYNGLRTRKFKNTEVLLRHCQLNFY